MLTNKLLGAAKVAGAANYVEDVFSTWLYTGSSAARAINNGIALGSGYGGSVFFDGSGDYLRVGGTVGIANNAFTICFWFYPLSTSVVGLFDSGSGQTNVFRNYPTNTIEDQDGGNVSFAGAFTANAWNWMCITKSGTSFTVYINGTTVGTGGCSAAMTETSFDIGGINSATAGSYNGYISDFAILNTATVIGVPTAPRTAISGTTLLTCKSPSPTTDYSSNAYPITVTNAIAQNGGGAYTDSTANKGGLVWIKCRSNSRNNQLVDTVRGATQALISNTTDAQTSDGSGLVSFSSTGFLLGSSSTYNYTGETFASWTFRKQAKFFDVVTYTGDGTSVRSISHNLGSTPGCIIVKRTDSTGDWSVYHRSLGVSGGYIRLNSTAAASGTAFATPINSTVFSIESGAPASMNVNGGTYVAYLFAHDAGGFGLSGTDNVISCGSFTTNTAETVTVNLGYEPQFVIVKRSDAVGDWYMLDTMRGWDNSGSDAQLYPNYSNAEGYGQRGEPNATGFRFTEGAVARTYIYIAIRRPMKTPTSGTSVFSPVARTGTSATATMTAGFAPDAVFLSNRNRTTTNYNPVYDKLRGNNAVLSANNTGAEQSLSGSITQYTNTGLTLGSDAFGNINASGATYINWIFQRAPGFFDVVCYTGTNANQTLNHNLSVAPEFIIVKKRSGSSGDFNWFARVSLLGSGFLYFNLTNDYNANTLVWTSTVPTSTQFTVGQYISDASSSTYVAYLFASAPGVSKVGSYTGTGTTQVINCGFTAGARFVLIKATSTTGNWLVWDSARGIVAGNDPYLALNSTAAEVTNTDWVDTAATGFELSNDGGNLANSNGVSYIFLAIA